MLTQVRRCAVLGSPIQHSLSPAIHRAAYAWLGLDWTFEAVEVDAAGFAEFLAGLDGGWRGLACTMPLKEVAAACGTSDADVRLTGVANTVLLEPDGRRVHNTDIPGFVAALAGGGVTRVHRPLVLGTGATARSALVALARLGAQDLAVTGRTTERVADLVGWARSVGLPAAPASWGGPIPAGTDVLVSTIPAAGQEAVLSRLDVGAAVGLRAVFDVSYHPWPTALATRAGALGVTVVNGLDLLVGQAVRQVELMTGQLVPAEVLASAVREELLRRAGT